jgi:hypothetical protein
MTFYFYLIPYHFFSFSTLLLNTKIYLVTPIFSNDAQARVHTFQLLFDNILYIINYRNVAFG